MSILSKVCSPALYSANATSFTKPRDLAILLSTKYGFRGWQAQIPTPSLKPSAPYSGDEDLTIAAAYISRIFSGLWYNSPKIEVYINARRLSMLHRRCSHCLLHTTHCLHRSPPSQLPHHHPPHCYPHLLRLLPHLPHLHQQAHRPSACTSVSGPPR